VSEGYHFEDEVQERPYDGRLMRRLLGYLSPYRYRLVGATLLLLAATLFSNVTPLLNMRAIDWYINSADRTALEKSGMGAAAQLNALVERDTQGLMGLLLLIAGLMTAEAAMRYMQGLIVTFVGQRAMLEMRLALFGHLQRMSLRFLDKNPIGRLMTRVTNDVENIQERLVSDFIEVVSQIFTLVIVLGFIFWLNWRLALITLIPVPGVVISSLLFKKYARSSYLNIRKKIAAVNAYMQENVSGMRVVQIFNREDDNFSEYERRNRVHRDEWLRQIRNFAIYFPVVEFWSSLAIALIILYGGLQILGGHEVSAGVASIGMLFAYVQWADRLFGPIRTLADKYNLIQDAMASSERVFALLDTPEEVKDKPEAVAATDVQGEVEFRSVWFAYEHEQWVLKDINITIAPGERVAIVGHTGAGKSTLANLLSRFYDVPRGAVLVDGVDVRDYEQRSLRGNIGMVLQDVFLFSGTVMRNLRLGNEDLSEARIRECAEYVNAARFIERLPGGYEYDVGERGGNLSTGQRQLLAFARTLAHDPRILVLDEATSSVDTEAEMLIQDAIGKLMQGRTCIMIAHRLSTVQRADRILVMHHGEIRESGTHQELLAKRGLYYTLYLLQYKDQNGGA
jgi:ATP-binding cassette subfamily B protein